MSTKKGKNLTHSPVHHFPYLSVFLSQLSKKMKKNGIGEVYIKIVL